MSRTLAIGRNVVLAEFGGYRYCHVTHVVVKS